MLHTPARMKVTFRTRLYVADFPFLELSMVKTVAMVAVVVVAVVAVVAAVVLALANTPMY